jgi:hypothetical protein
MSVPYIWVNGELTVVLKNKSYQVLKDHINYKLIVDALKANESEDELLKLVDVPKAVAAFSDGKVEIRDGQVYYGKEVVHGSISKRILEFMGSGFPFQPLVNFLENLMKNPSMQSQKELYDFLEHESLPITEDGHFLAYKAVGPNYMDKYRGVYDNSVGNVCEMPRGSVDDDRSVGCSQGLHAGALNYVATYGNVDNGDHIVIVKINPADVVSVPKECNCEKLRTCRYEVVAEYEGELKKPLYSTSSGSIYDNDDEDEEEEYDWDRFDEDYDDEDDEEENPWGVADDDDEDDSNNW